MGNIFIFKKNKIKKHKRKTKQNEKTKFFKEKVTLYECNNDYSPPDFNQECCITKYCDNGNCHAKWV